MHEEDFRIRKDFRGNVEAGAKWKPHLCRQGCSDAGKVRHLALLKADSGIRLQAQRTAQSWDVVAMLSAFNSLGDSMEVCSPEVGLQ